MRWSDPIYFAIYLLCLSSEYAELFGCGKGFLCLRFFQESKNRALVIFDVEETVQDLKVLTLPSFYPKATYALFAASSVKNPGRSSSPGTSLTALAAISANLACFGTITEGAVSAANSNVHPAKGSPLKERRREAASHPAKGSPLKERRREAASAYYENKYST
jgi:hypothetical protein